MGTTKSGNLTSCFRASKALHEMCENMNWHMFSLCPFKMGPCLELVRDIIMMTENRSYSVGQLVSDRKFEMEAVTYPISEKG